MRADVRTSFQQPPKSGEVANHTSSNRHTGMSAYSESSGAGAGASSAGMNYAHLPPLQRKIIECILSQPRRDDGVHVAYIARNVRAEANEIR